jgi:hypothetical protein
MNRPGDKLPREKDARTRPPPKAATLTAENVASCRRVHDFLLDGASASKGSEIIALTSKIDELDTTKDNDKI